MSQDASPPAGWYADPFGAPRLRYWDGEAWTDRLEEAPSALIDVDSLASDARRAKIAVALGVPFYAATPAVQGVQIRDSRKRIADFREQLDVYNQVAPGQQYQPLRPSPVSSIGSATSLPVLVIGVLFLIWFHRAASAAARVQRPARRTPGWAVGGWLIPIGNFYLPYQSARDIFPPKDPRRRIVAQWWTAYIVALTVNLPLGVVAGFHDEPEVAIAASALALVFWLYAAIKAHEFIDAANTSLTGSA